MDECFHFTNKIETFESIECSHFISDIVLIFFLRNWGPFWLVLSMLSLTFSSDSVRTNTTMFV